MDEEAKAAKAAEVKKLAEEEAAKEAALKEAQKAIDNELELGILSEE